MSTLILETNLCVMIIPFSFTFCYFLGFHRLNRANVFKIFTSMVRSILIGCFIRPCINFYKSPKRWETILVLKTTKRQKRLRSYICVCWGITCVLGVSLLCVGVSLLCVGGITFVCWGYHFGFFLCYFSIGYWNCSEIVKLSVLRIIGHNKINTR